MNPQNYIKRVGPDHMQCYRVERSCQCSNFVQEWEAHSWQYGLLCQWEFVH